MGTDAIGISRVSVSGPTPLERRRRELLARIPSWYSGTAHWLLINLVILGVIAACLVALERPAPWEWLFVPGFFVFANAFEWWIHRGPMHHPTRFLYRLYQRHTLEHHVVFADTAMPFRDSRELFYVLFPPLFLPAILVANSPIPLLLSVAISPNLGLLFFGSALAYYLVYEWFHFLHHLPPTSWLGRRSLVGRFRRHHTRHHELARMEKGNFNVSFPLWDWILETMLED